MGPRTAITTAACLPLPQGLNPTNIYLQSQQLESVLAYHTLPQPFRSGKVVAS